MKNLSTRIRFTQVIVYLLGAFPLIWLIWDAINNNLTANPIQALTLKTGKYALVFLVLSLACTPVNTLFGFRQALKLRRPLGLFAFFYAWLHVSVFFVLDYALDIRLIVEELLAKRYLLAGLVAFLILLALAITSFDWWKLKLKQNWKRLHKLVYLAAPLVVLHYLWGVKGDLWTLSGQIVQPILFGIAVLAVLLMRLRVVRQFILARRYRLDLIRLPRKHTIMD